MGGTMTPHLAKVGGGRVVEVGGSPAENYPPPLPQKVGGAVVVGVLLLVSFVRVTCARGCVYPWRRFSGHRGRARGERAYWLA